MRTHAVEAKITPHLSQVFTAQNSSCCCCPAKFSSVSLPAPPKSVLLSNVCFTGCAFSKTSNKAAVQFLSSIGVEVEADCRLSFFLPFFHKIYKFQDFDFVNFLWLQFHYLDRGSSSFLPYIFS